ncbi:MAG: tRNA epoxyqueuosine(34) reductase QueG [Verrucomicrobia bacterium]|nr:tRNA epoxyqueuosine(34) reductase QueG [Verrucomicrobiota bacterium]
MDRSALLKEMARTLGLDAMGIARAVAPAEAPHLSEWLQLSYHGEMSWMAKTPGIRMDPTAYDSGARTIIVAGLLSRQVSSPLPRGRIACYAQGEDYHEVLREHLESLAQKTIVPWGGKYRITVDSSPVMEKPLAALAGLGWQGKNTLLIHPEHGPWLLLGCLLTDLDIAPDSPAKDHCGSCTRCLDACPTQAFPQPYVLDARRCLAYLTIEHPGSIPLEFRPLIGDRIFGCDECLEVCPWNRHARESREIRLQPISRPDLAEMLSWDDARFRKEFRGTPIFRLKRHRWIRNLCVVLGNIGTFKDLPALREACRDENPLIQEHASWAVQQIESRQPSITKNNLARDPRRN